MIKRIFHGSQKIIEKPIFGYGKQYKDYGCGFYTTENIDLAKEWAVTNNRDGYVNIYEIDIEGLSILNLNHNSFTILTWLTLLLQNRNFPLTSDLAIEGKEYLINNFYIPYEDFDIIIGYRADDSYFSYAEDFLNGTISLRKLENAMNLGKLGEQFVLKSKKAFSLLHFIDSQEAKKNIWYPKKLNRDTNAREEYFLSRKITTTPVRGGLLNAYKACFKLFALFKMRQ